MVASLYTGTTIESKQFAKGFGKDFFNIEDLLAMVSTAHHIQTTLYKKVLENRTFFWVFCLLLSQFSFLTTLTLPYIGEEGVYTITSLEMWQNSEWISPTLFGNHYTRPPFFNWLIIPIANVLGWEHMLIASRLVTGFATLLISLVLMVFVQRLFKDKNLSLLSALIFLGGDVLLRRGWLAYADPLFSLFVFSAIACAWIAIKEQRSRFLLLAVLGVIASFLTKAITGYVFYGISLCVLFFQSKNRKFLLKPLPLFLHFVALAFPFIWSRWISQGGHGNGMIGDVLNKLNTFYLLDYFTKLLWFPLDTILICWLPISGLLFYFSWRYYRKERKFSNVVRDIKHHLNDKADPNTHFTSILWIFILNYIPYWLAPEFHMRYLMPLYPLMALIFAYCIWKMGESTMKIAVLWILILILLRYAAGFWAFPYFEQRSHGDYAAIAQEILGEIQGKSLYAQNDNAKCLSVIAHLDTLRLPEHFLNSPTNASSGFIISSEPTLPDTKIEQNYQTVTQPLYLLCNLTTKGLRVAVHNNALRLPENFSNMASSVSLSSSHLPKTEVRKIYQLGRQKLYLLCTLDAC